MCSARMELQAGPASQPPSQRAPGEHSIFKRKVRGLQDKQNQPSRAQGGSEVFNSKHLFKFIHQNPAHPVLTMLESSTNEGHFRNFFPKNSEREQVRLTTQSTTKHRPQDSRVSLILRDELYETYLTLATATSSSFLSRRTV